MKLFDRMLVSSMTVSVVFEGTLSRPKDERGFSDFGLRARNCSALAPINPKMKVRVKDLHHP
jgi:hypothetical protein